MWYYRVIMSPLSVLGESSDGGGAIKREESFLVALRKSKNNPVEESETIK